MKNNRHELTEFDFQAAAWWLRCDVPTIKAVAEVETGKRGGFDAQGRPTILFERHWFHRLTGGAYDEAYPRISNRKWGGYGRYSEQHGKLELAASLNREAALKSCSWGAFQVMGFNFELAGHKTLQGFVNAMYRSKADHLRAFVAFLMNRRLDDELRRHDWRGLAHGYNGPKYEENQWHTKMARAHARFILEES